MAARTGRWAVLLRGVNVGGVRIRMAELAQSGTSRTLIANYLTDMCATLADLMKRAEAAAPYTTDRSAARQVPKSVGEHG